MSVRYKGHLFNFTAFISTNITCEESKLKTCNEQKN